MVWRVACNYQSVKLEQPLGQLVLSFDWHTVFVDMKNYCHFWYRLFEETSQTRFMQKPVNWFATQIKELVSILNDFLLKVLFEHALEGIEH